jgi:4-amino-4-deoxy-L-arabinose transferase-like glycosyltransferase
MTGRLVVAAILATALLVRLGLAVFYDPPPFSGDAADFARHAVALADEGSYPASIPTGGPTAFRPPGYPFALAAVYEAAGREDAPRVFGALLGTLAVALLGVVGLRLFGRRVALVAMAITAVFPPLVMVSVAQLSEALFIVLVLGALACVLAAPDRMRWVLAAGALAGAAALTRTNGLAILLPLLLAARGTRPRVALLAAALVVIAPWSIRSSTALDTFVPTTTQPGFALAGAYNDVARTDEEHPAAWRVPRMQPYAGLLKPAMNEAELERAFRREAVDYALEHPTYPFVVVFWASARMLNVADATRDEASAREAGVGARFAAANRYAFWLLALLAVAGAFTRAARAAPRWVWLFPVLLWFGVAITIGSTRYRTPVDPFVILLAALALERASAAARSRAASRRGTAPATGRTAR